MAPLTSNPECSQIKYIDCRNWLQFTQQLLTLLLTFTLLLHVTKHYRNLKKQKQSTSTSEYQKSIRRKIRVNLIQLLYLICLFFNTIYDIILFTWYRNKDNRMLIKEYKLDGWYKVTELLYVNWLNSLNLTVGFLYWKATRAYYVLSELEVMWVYRRWVKILFFLFFCFNGVAVAVGVVLQIVGIVSEDAGMIMSIFTLISTTTSIICCIGCRILYRRYILTKVHLSPKAIKKQKIMSILLCMSSILRIISYTVDTTIPDWSEYLRNQQLDQQTGICWDNNLYYSIVLLGINLIINLLPAAIYGHLFVSQVNMNSQSNDDRRHRLRSDDSLQS